MGTCSTQSDVCCAPAITDDSCVAGNGVCKPFLECQEGGGTLARVLCPGNNICCISQSEPDGKNCEGDEAACGIEQNCIDNGGTPLTDGTCPGSLVCCNCPPEEPDDDCVLAGGDFCTDLPTCVNLGGTIIEEPDIDCPQGTQCCKGVGTQYELLNLKVNSSIKFVG